MERSLISWNLPNVITIFFMIACVWGIAALGGKAIRGKSSTEASA